MPESEILALTEGIHESKLPTQAHKQLLNMDITVKIVVDSKDLFTSLVTQSNSIDRCLRNDVACITHEFQVGSLDEVSWIPRNLNLADVLKKQNCPLGDPLLSTLYTGRPQVDYES